jgi:hypothetical protein
MNTVKKCVSPLDKLKYLYIIMENQNCIDEEINGKLQSVNTSLVPFISHCFVFPPAIEERKIYSVVLLLALLYGFNTRSGTLTDCLTCVMWM